MPSLLTLWTLSQTQYSLPLYPIYVYRIFNTNNLWMKLTAIKRLVEEKKMHMEVIVNNKVRDYDCFK